jgi:cytochrome oxidase Cu insertion factor (SCO1/SenC/PrrC family)
MSLAAGPCFPTEDPGRAGAPRMDFVPPPAGSYTLQKIQRIADAALLDSGGHSLRLQTLTRGKISLLTFFYSYCVDPLGCPFAHTTLAELRDRLKTDPALAGRVQFIIVSLDPTHDTPAAIAAYAGEFTDPNFEWRFLTASGVPELLPVLDDFGQDVSVELDERGRATRTLHHMLKMFLIDGRGEIREIYTLAFIQPPVIFNDIKTLAMESARRIAAAPTAAGSRR